MPNPMLDWNKEKRGKGKAVAQMGWEQRGTHQYFYRKEREGSRVKSIYVGRGEIAKMISQFQSSSSVLENLARETKTANETNQTGRCSSLSNSFNF